jgi:hypothetical protein
MLGFKEVGWRREDEKSRARKEQIFFDKEETQEVNPAPPKRAVKIRRNRRKFLLLRVESNCPSWAVAVRKRLERSVTRGQVLVAFPVQNDAGAHSGALGSHWYKGKPSLSFSINLWHLLPSGSNSGLGREPTQCGTSSWKDANKS